MRGMNDITPVRDYLTDLQDRICAAIEAADGSARFHEDGWSRAPGDPSPIPDGNPGHNPANRTLGVRIPPPS